MLVQVGDLPLINREGGRQRGDDYLNGIAERLTQALHSFPDHMLSRHSGADFAIFVPAIAEIESQELMEFVYSRLHETDRSGDEMQSVYVGALFIPKLRDSDNFMALADVALSHAQNEQKTGCYWHKVDKSERSLSAREWSELIQRGIEEKSVSFHFQPVWRLIHGEKRLLFNEAMVRMNVDGTEYPAGHFMPMATRFNMLPAIDCLVLKQLVNNQNELPEYLCINLSIASIEDVNFLAILEQFLDNSSLAPRVTFELPASALSFAKKSVRRFVTMVKSKGAGFSLHHFGKGSSEFDYLQTLSLDYLKIDRCFVQNIEHDNDARFFICSLVGIARSCDVTVLAEGVETETQWQMLIDLGVQGGQGYWLGEPMSNAIEG
ncbi:hypothetical protein AB835_01705 [Candidatus Endobugula sertula]|uniref:EAL domain-containing protein n=1 Tax=Candidatus Endobugula sertula TaxID=62101 RepID=A0A1D2QT87_9GAMM|nr:hypothetical protein AB835_01705 [Candidatus Endobugula sertula]